MAYSFDFINNIINVTSPQVEVTCQELINEIRNIEDEQINIGYPSIASATGKQSLGGGVTVGITIELLNNWQVKFWNGNYIAKVTGGNLVGGLGGDPIAYSAGVQVLLIQSAASTIVTTGSGPLTSEQNSQLMATALETTAQDVKTSTDTINWSDIVSIDTNVTTINNNVSSMDIKIDTIDNNIDSINTNVQAVKLKTDTINWSTIDTIALHTGDIATIQKLTGNNVTKSGDIITIYEDNGVTIWRQYDLSAGGRIVI